MKMILAAAALAAIASQSSAQVSPARQIIPTAGAIAAVDALADLA